MSLSGNTTSMRVEAVAELELEATCSLRIARGSNQTGDPARCRCGDDEEGGGRGDLSSEAVHGRRSAPLRYSISSSSFGS
eukprot:773825-Rhodomonas_salina.1